MSTVLATVAPVFGLIGIGYAGARSGYLSEAAARGLPEVIFKLVMPIMLFRTIGEARLPDVPVVAPLAMFFGAAAATWIIAALVTRWPLGRPASDAPGIAMGAAFSNSVMLGIPVVVSHFGPGAVPVLALVIALDTALFWLWAMLHVAAIEGARAGSIGAMAATLGRRLATNPIILGCVAGLAWQAVGVPLPPLLDKTISLIAAAAIPGALLALGTALSGYGLAGQMPAVAAITTLKLVAMPALAWLLWALVLDVPASAAGVVLVLTAMPVGANAYLFAAAYGRAPAAVSGAIALSTLLAVATVSALLLLIGPPGG